MCLVYEAASCRPSRSPPAKQEAIWSSCRAGMHFALPEHALLLLFLKLLEGFVREVLGVHCRLFLITEF